MDRKKSGLSRKITVLCLMLAVVICAGACTVGYFTYRNSIYEAYSSFAYSLAYTASSYVDGDRITGYLDTGTPDEAYDEMARRLNTIYRSTELSSIYISKPKPETMTLLNIYDVRVHEAADPAPYAIGVEDPITGDPEEVVRIYETGELSDSYFIRKSRFGYNTSAILPVQNSTGETVAILVADMPMPNIIRDLNRYLALTVAVTALLGLLVLGTRWRPWPGPWPKWSGTLPGILRTWPPSPRRRSASARSCPSPPRFRRTCCPVSFPPSRSGRSSISTPP